MLLAAKGRTTSLQALRPGLALLAPQLSSDELHGSTDAALCAALCL